MIWNGGVGNVGGAVRFGQPHGDKGFSDGSICCTTGGWLSNDAAEVSVGEVMASPIVGNLCDMIPKSVHAALLKKKGPEVSVM